MASTLRPIGHEDRLSLVEHLDELRTRLIICVVAYVVLFGLCFWQNDRVLDIMNVPLEKTAFKGGSEDPFEQNAAFQQRLGAAARQAAPVLRELSKDAGDPELARQGERAARALESVARATPDATPKKPITTGVGEPFTATARVAGYAALLLALPLLLYQLYAFVLPAFSPTERKVALPLMLMVPFLFVAGVAFGYFVLLPPAINFLQNFNDDNYDILLQARDYYAFSILVIMAMGLLFQTPIAILGVTRVGIVTTAQLRRNRRYAILVIAVLAMLLPGQDPVTMLLMMLPLIVLYEGSILLATLLDRRAERARAREEAEMAAANDSELLPFDPDE
jgi:sec-independent protein translocase protein TatC